MRIIATLLLLLVSSARADQCFEQVVVPCGDGHGYEAKLSAVATVSICTQYGCGTVQTINLRRVIVPVGGVGQAYNGYEIDAGTYKTSAHPAAVTLSGADVKATLDLRKPVRFLLVSKQADDAYLCVYPSATGLAAATYTDQVDRFGVQSYGAHRLNYACIPAGVDGPPAPGRAWYLGAAVRNTTLFNLPFVSVSDVVFPGPVSTKITNLDDRLLAVLP
jgi:hypothetical protein